MPRLLSTHVERGQLVDRVLGNLVVVVRSHHPPLPERQGAPRRWERPSDEHHSRQWNGHGVVRLTEALALGEQYVVHIHAYLRHGNAPFEGVPVQTGYVYRARLFALFQEEPEMATQAAARPFHPHFGGVQQHTYGVPRVRLWSFQPPRQQPKIT